MPATGYKLIIQLLASIDPQIFPSCCSKTEVLMGSYQNKPPIGLSILWAIGQAGLLDFNIGIKGKYNDLILIVLIMLICLIEISFSLV